MIPNPALSKNIQNTIIALKRLNDTVHDRALGIAGDKLPDYMRADISVFFNPGFAYYEKFKLIGINTLNDFRLFKFNDFKTIEIDGQPLFTKDKYQKLRDDVHKHGGLFYNDQKNLGEAKEIIEKGKRKFQELSSTKIVPHNKNDITNPEIDNLSLHQSTGTYGHSHEGAVIRKLKLNS